MKLYHHIHRVNHKIHNKDLRELDIFIFLHNIGNSLISVFIPIILYQIGFSIAQIFLYLFLFSVIDLPLNFIAKKGVLRLGAREAIMIGLIAEIIYFLILYNAKLELSTLIILAFFAALYDSFYWVGQWFIFNEIIKPSDGVGKETSFYMNARNIANFISPGIGALVLIFFSKEYLILVTLFLFIVSLLFLFKINKKHLKHIKRKGTKSYLSYKFNRINISITGLWALHEDIEHIIFPLFIFVTFATIGGVGLLPMITAFGSILFALYIGRQTDKHNKIVLISIGTFIIAFVWIIRLFFPQISIYMITTFLIGFISVSIFIPLESKRIEDGRKTNMLDASVYRNASWVFMSSILYGVLYFAIDKFHVSFITAIFVMFTLGIFGTMIVLLKKK